MKKILYIVVACCCLHGLYAQDIFFSQFYNSPLTLNPALTGVSGADGLYNLSYRNNDRGLIPYTTTAFSGDMPLFRAYFYPDRLSLGLLLANDRFNKGQMTNLNLLLSGAYHWQISPGRFLSGGLQLGLFQRKFDLNSLSFGEQYNVQTGFDERVVSRESFSTERTLNFDLNGGFLYYDLIDSRTSYFFGLSLYHMNAPRDKFQSAYAQAVRFPMRSVVHGGGQFSLSEIVDVSPRAMFLVQNNNYMLIHGLSFVYNVREYATSVDAGVWFRHSDNCLIASLGIRFVDYYLALSSDFISSLQTVSQTHGALELSFRYMWRRDRNLNLRANPRNRY